MKIYINEMRKVFKEFKLKSDSVWKEKNIFPVTVQRVLYQDRLCS